MVVAGILYLIEFATVQLVSIWFVAGALVTAIVALFGASGAVQLGVFFVTSIVFLIVARPILKTKLQIKRQPTNADRVIGMYGLVTETVDNLALTGRVTANGLSWAARAQSDTMRINEGQRIKVLQIDGNKLIVEPIMEQAEQTEQADQTCNNN